MKEFTLTKQIVKHGNQCIIIVPKCLCDVLTPKTLVEVKVKVIRKGEEKDANN